MTKLNRGQVLNVIYYAGVLLLAGPGVLLVFAGLIAPAMIAPAMIVAALASLWMIGLPALALVFEPALLRWVNYGEDIQARRTEGHEPGD